MGIGAELAERLAEAGFHLLLVARRLDALNERKEQLQAAHGVEVAVLSADLSTSAAIAHVIETSQALDIGLFIPCAGYGTSGAFTESKLETERNLLRVNCEAVLALTHHFAQRFVQRGKGGMVLLGSLVGFQGTPYAAHYAATKAYVQSLAEALSVELKPRGVDVLAAAPGPVASGFAQRANMKMDMALTPQQVGVPILKALGRQQTVLPGFLTKLLVYSLRSLPRWGKVRVMKLVMGGMTQHQRQ